MIRIIGGKFKGRRIVGVVKDPLVRPITGRMRQSLFDIIRPRVVGCRFLDLYAGSGAVGLEALSRGAGQVVFVERDPRCAKSIERNVANMELTGQTGEVLRQDILASLGRLRGRSFDLIFAGPPYKDDQKRPLNLTAPTRDAVRRGSLLAPGGILVIQHHKTDQPPPDQGLRLFRREKYGDSLVDFYRRSEDSKEPETAGVVSVTEAPEGDSSTEEEGVSAPPGSIDRILTRQGGAVTLMLTRTRVRAKGQKGGPAGKRALWMPAEENLRGWDLNPRPQGYEPCELPGCSTPQKDYTTWTALGQ